MLSKHERMAGRAYDRLLAQLTEGLHVVIEAEAEAGLEGWCGPQYQAAFEDAQKRASNIVGDRFEIDPERIITIVEYDMMMEWFDRYEAARPFLGMQS